jgi:RNA polymerase sigma factor (TIGR02999 family)
MTSHDHRSPADPKPDHAVTRLLLAWGQGDQDAFEQLSDLVYNDLRRIAQRQMRGEREGHTLNPTALVHEAILQLIRYDKRNLRNREHFYNLAAKLMRQVLVNYAEARNARKRGAGVRPVELDEADRRGSGGLSGMEEMLAVNEALERLATESERRAQVVKLKYFLGLSDKEAAAALEVSEKTVEREWKEAREWLRAELSTGREVNHGN